MTHERTKKLIIKFMKKVSDRITRTVNDRTVYDLDNSVRIPVQQYLEHIRDYDLSEARNEIFEEIDQEL